MPIAVHPQPTTAARRRRFALLSLAKAIRSQSALVCLALYDDLVADSYDMAEPEVVE